MSEESQGSDVGGMPPEGGRPLLLANPAAGAGRGRARLERLAAALDSWPEPPEIVWSGSFEDLRSLAASAAHAGRRWVIAAGGDGTAHAVVDGLLSGKGDTPDLGYLPIGTSGDFGRSLGLPRGAEAVARGLPGWSAHAIDVGTVVVAGGGRCPLLNCANVGLAPRVVDRVRVSPLLRRAGGLAYPIGAALETRAGSTETVRLSVDGEPAWEGEVMHLSVANGAFFGGGLRPIAAASLVSGRLHLLGVGRMGRLEAVRQLVRALRQRPPTNASVRLAEGSVVRLDGSARLEVDGQLVGRLPATIEIRQAALRARCPGPVGPRSAAPV